MPYVSIFQVEIIPVRQQYLIMKYFDIFSLLVTGC